MSKIWFAGDVHGRFSHVLKTLEQAESRPQAIVFLGDLEPSRLLRLDADSRSCRLATAELRTRQERLFWRRVDDQYFLHYADGRHQTLPE